MTINAGWTKGDHAYLLADSAVTRRRAPRTDQSNLGQRNQDDTGRAVEDGYGKLIRVGTHAVASICGDLAAANAFVNELRESHSDRGESLQDAVERASTHARELDAGAYRSLIATWDDGPRLYFTSSEDPLVRIEPDSVATTGSLGDPHARQLENMILSLPSRDPSDTLGAALAAATVMGVQEDLISHNVGGAFFGVSVGPRGVCWQKDTIYLFFDPGESGEPPQNVHLMHCCVRDEVLASYSTITSEFRAHIPHVVGRKQEWDARWRPVLGVVERMFVAERIALIPISGGETLYAEGFDDVLRCSPNGGVLLREDLARYLTRTSWRESGVVLWPAADGEKLPALDS